MKLIDFKCPSCKTTIDTATEINHSQEITSKEIEITKCFFSQEAHIHCPRCKKRSNLIVEKQKIELIVKY